MRRSESRNTRRLARTSDAVLCALAMYSGLEVHGAELDDAHRVALLFDADALRAVESALMQGTASVEPIRFAAVYRQMHSTYFTPEAKRRIGALGTSEKW